MTEDQEEIVADQDIPKRVRGVRAPTPRDLVPEFARMIRRKRLEQVPAMSQRTLAATAGVSPMCVSEIESQKRSPSLRVAAQLARALRMEIKLFELVNDGAKIDEGVRRAKMRTAAKPSRKLHFKRKKKEV